MAASLLGSTVRNIRRGKGLSQEALAERAKLKTITLRDAETGRRTPTFQTLGKIATALGEPIETFARLLPGTDDGMGFSKRDIQIQSNGTEKLLSTAAPGTVATGCFSEEHDVDRPWSPAITVDQAQWLARIDMIMDRRTAIHVTTAAIAGSTGLLAPLEGWLDPSPALAAKTGSRTFVGRLGTQDVAELQQAAEIFHRWYYRSGGGLRREAVVGQLNGVAALLDEHQGTEVEKDLFRVMAQLASTAAKMSGDMDLPRLANDYYRLSVRSAHAGGDMLLGADALSSMAWQMRHAGRPQDALELVHFAQSGSADVAGPRMRAKLFLMEGAALAELGRVKDFQMAIARAGEALAEAEPEQEPYWLQQIDHAELAGFTGTCLRGLAMRDNPKFAEQASIEVERALAARGMGLAHVINWTDLAESRFILGDIVAAADSTKKAAEVASQVRSSWVRKRLRTLQGYAQRHPSSAPMREAGAALDKAITGIA